MRSAMRNYLSPEQDMITLSSPPTIPLEDRARHMGLEEAVISRYGDLQSYVGWTSADAERLAAAAPLLAPCFAAWVDEFYQEIQRHPPVSSVITGGEEQVARLKQTLRQWLAEFFSGKYDEFYIARRWGVGLRHVEIGLPQVYTVAAVTRLRNAMIVDLCTRWQKDNASMVQTLQSLNKLLDLDLAIIGDAYESEFVQRQQLVERRRLDDILHREKELAAGLLAHAQAAVVVLDRAGCVRRWNRFLETLVDTNAPVGIEGRDWFDWFLEPKERETARALLLGEKSAESAQLFHATSKIQLSGRTFYLHWSGGPLHDAGGSPFAVLAIGQDVTALYDAQQRSLQAERLAAIGQMATGLAHESRAALQRIGASAEMLEMELEDNETALTLVFRIQQAQIHLHRLLDEVRNYAAPIVLDRSPCRITETWREAWELLLSQRRGRDAQLREQLETSDLVIEADRFRLIQVFRNLLDNSLAAAKDPVEIEVRCESAELHGKPALRVCVRDNGPGLNPEQRRRMFEPFFTTKPTGTGLGTAIAQRLVEAHGGTVVLGTNASSGAEIIVTLPRQLA